MLEIIIRQDGISLCQLEYRAGNTLIGVASFPLTSEGALAAQTVLLAEDLS